MELPIKRVEEILHARVPISKAINCQVLEASDKSVKLTVPKFVNTVVDEGFSDLSSITLCKLAAWTLLQVSLQRLDYKPFATLSSSKYFKTREIDANSARIFAVCQIPAEKEWQQFLRMLTRKNRARVEIVATLSDELGEAASLTCEYDTRDLDPV